MPQSETTELPLHMSPKLYAYMIDDGKGREVIAGFKSKGRAMPLVFARRSEALRFAEAGRMLAAFHRRPVRLVKYLPITTLETFEP